MASGNITRTPDYVLDGTEDITNEKINRTGSGVFRVDEGAITDRELSVSLTGGFDTVAALRDNTSEFTDGTGIDVKGYYTDGAGDFGPTLYYDASDSVTADDGLSCFVDQNGARYKRTFNTPINVKWAGAKGDETYGGPYNNNDTPSFQIAIDTASSSGNTIFVPAGVYRWNTAFTSNGSGLPFVKRFEMIGESDSKHHQLIESWGYSDREQSVIVIDLSADPGDDSLFAFDCLDTVSVYPAEQYGPYVCENLIFKCEQGSGFRYGGLTTTGNYDADDPLEAFVHGVRFRNCYATGKKLDSWMDASQELLAISTNQKFLEIAKGFECELDNVALRGFYIQVDAHLCDNFLFNRIRTSHGFIPIRSNSYVPSQVQNLQIEGVDFLCGLVGNNTRINSSRFENGYSGDMGKFRATNGGTHVNWSVTAGTAYIDLTNLNGNQPSDYFHEHMVLELVDSSSNSFLVYIDSVDDANDRLVFKNYDGNSRFHTTTTGTEVNRYWGYHFVVFGESSANDVSLAYNNDPTDDSPNHFVVPGAVPIAFTGVSGLYGGGNLPKNRGRIVAHTMGRQYRLGGLLYLNGCSGFLCEENTHPMVGIDQLNDPDNANKRGMGIGASQADTWLFTPQEGITAFDSGCYNYFEKVDDLWVLRKDLASPSNYITFDGGHIQVPSERGIYRITCKAKAVTGTQTLQVLEHASDPGSGSNRINTTIGTDWKIVEDVFISTHWEGATASSSNTIKVAGVDVHIAWIRLERLDRFGDTEEELYMLQGRSDTADFTSDGEVYDVVETVATYQVTYNSVAYTDGQNFTVSSGDADDIADLDSGTGRLLNQKRIFTPSESCYLAYISFDSTGAYYTTAIYRITELASEWTLTEVWKTERSSTLTVTPSIVLATGEVTLGVNSFGTSDTNRINCRHFMSNNRDTVEAYINSYT